MDFFADLLLNRVQIAAADEAVLFGIAGHRELVGFIANSTAYRFDFASCRFVSSQEHARSCIKTRFQSSFRMQR